MLALPESPTGLEAHSTPLQAARRAAISSAWLLLENGLRLVATATVSFWAARELGPADFGLLNSASALAAVLLALATLGLDVPTVLRLARGDSAAVVLGTVLRLRLLASLAALLLAVLAAVALRSGDPRAQLVMLVVALSVVAYVPMVLDCAFKAQVEAGPPARARLATTLLAAAAKAAVLLADAGVQALAWTVVFEAVMASLLMAAAWRRHGSAQPIAGSRASPAITLRFDPALARDLLRQSLPMLGAAAAVALLLKADLVLLAHLGDDLQAGHYALAQKLSEVLYVLPLVLVDSVYPLLAQRQSALPSDAPAQTQPHELSDQLLFDLAFAAGLLCSGACVLLAAPVVVGLFGPAYENTVPLWRVHGLTCIAVALDVARQRWLVARGLQRQALLSALLAAILAIGLNLWLIPTHGATAAAAVAVTAWFGAGLLATLVWHRNPRTQPLAGLQLRAMWPWVRLWHHFKAWRT